MEALGGANAAVPFMSSIILGAEAIRLAGSEAQKAAWLPKLASGDAIATFAYAEGPGSAFATGATLDGGQLSGSKLPVDDGGNAHIGGVPCACVELAVGGAGNGDSGGKRGS